jgi:hypothetical protein
VIGVFASKTYVSLIIFSLSASVIKIYSFGKLICSEEQTKLSPCFFVVTVNQYINVFWDAVKIDPVKIGNQ